MKGYRQGTGFTVIELVVAVAVFALALSAIASGVSRGTEFSTHAIKAVRNDEQAREPMKALTDLVNEAAFSSIDTSTRVYVGSWSGLATGESTVGFESDRFSIPGLPLRQCPSPTCGAHTDESSFAVEMRGYHCGYEWREGMQMQPEVKGKNWSSALGTCPLDGTPLTEAATLDAMKFFTPRGPDGSFDVETGSVPRPDFKHLGLVFPYRADSGTQVELRYYVVSVDDLASGISFSQGWDEWNPSAPSMFNLFDFGTDGTTDGDPDGSVPVNSDESDAQVEVFVVTVWEGEPTIVLYKVLGSQTSFPYREVQLRVRLRDGATFFSVVHYESANEFWTGTANFEREPRVLVTALTDFVASTERSHPHDEQQNPTGVEDGGVVRMCVGTTQRVVSQGVVSWPYRIDQLSLRPRN